MCNKEKDKIKDVKYLLLEKLKEEKAFWSFPEEKVSVDTIKDDQLIALTMRYLDLDEISLLFDIYTYRKVKNAWKKILVPEGEYLYTLNRFFSWYYFKARKPDSYLKSLQTRHTNAMFN